MVELYDLKLDVGVRTGGIGGALPPSSTTATAATNTADLDHWPLGGIDEHIAQLDFETSSIANEESIFSSIAAMDAVGLISTDSLDMEQLRQRCETNKNDYKLTFEDSGQWTTSGFGTGTSPSGLALRLDESDEEQRRRSAVDLLLNNDGDYPNGTFTTWGHIKNNEPPYDPKTNSMPPSVHFRPNQTMLPERRSTSLLANFVERQQLGANSTTLEQHRSHQAPTIPHDYEYSEQYLGDGRYIDLNSNEIGYAPISTASVQAGQTVAIKPTLPPVAPSATGQDRWPAAHRRSNGATPPRRTFANLDTNGPDLNFLSLPFKVPSFCRSSASLDRIFRHAQRADSNAQKIKTSLSTSQTEAFLTDLLDGSTTSASTAAQRLFQQKGSSSLGRFDAPDSGLGSSVGGGSTGGPSHIEDWNSLSILLPRHVVEACSFFKSNITLLADSASTTNLATGVIERKSRSAVGPCRHCTTLRLSATAHDRLARSQRETCYECTYTPNMALRKFSSLSLATTNRREERRQAYHQRARLRPEELGLIGLPGYDAKRQLVERVVEGVAEVVRGGQSTSLLEAFECLLSDGLRSGCHLWKIIVTLTKPGKATGTIYNIVQRLDVDEKTYNSRTRTFFNELLGLHSLDGYLSYIVLKEKQLLQAYDDGAFLLRAHSSYRSLFWRLIESLELLSVLSRPERCVTIKSTVPSASRLPRDSRIPKSTSEPLRLSVRLDKGLVTSHEAPVPNCRSLSTGGGTLDRRKRSRIPIPIVSSRQRSRSVKIRQLASLEL